MAPVAAEVPAQILRLGSEFMDTPGIGSAIETSTGTTSRFLPRADAIIVTGFGYPLTQAESAFLADADRRAAKMFLVVNKRDLVSAHDAPDVLDFIERQLPPGLAYVESGDPLRQFARIVGLSHHGRLPVTG